MEEKHETRLDVRVSVALRTRIRMAAAKSNLSTADWIRKVAQEAAERELSS
jgi:uncharacterized protein (DUF1778 family)